MIVYISPLVYRICTEIYGTFITKKDYIYMLYTLVQRNYCYS